MIAFFLSLALAAGVGTAGSPNPGTRSEIPKRLASGNPCSTAPLWVSIDQAFSDDGEVKAELFHPVSLRSLSSSLRRSATPGEGVPKAPASADPCETFSTSLFDDRPHQKPNGSLTDLTSHAVAIYRGSVDEIGVGFFGGDPGSLLLVRVERALRTSKLFANAPSVLVYYPYARATVGAYRICKTDLRFPHRPAAGDRVLVFAYEAPPDSMGRAIAPEHTEIVFESADGRLILPISLTGLDEINDLVGVESAMRRQLRDKGEPAD